MAEIRINSPNNLDGLIAALAGSDRKVPRKVADAVDDTTRTGIRIAKREAPVDTGRLESEIYGVATGLTGLVVSPTEYAHWVNGGTSRQAPNEYMGRTARIIEPDFIAAVTEAGRPNL